jgi:hypothetical protein
VAAAAADLRKTAVLTLGCKKRALKKTFFEFFFILVLCNLEFVMQKNNMKK